MSDTNWTPQPTARPYQKLHPLAHDAVRWTQGFWADRFRLCQETILPSMRQAMDDPDNAAWFGNLYIAAGLREGEQRGTFWSDGDCYKLIPYYAWANRGIGKMSVWLPLC